MSEWSENDNKDCIENYKYIKQKNKYNRRVVDCDEQLSLIHYCELNDIEFMNKNGKYPRCPICGCLSLHNRRLTYEELGVYKDGEIVKVF